MVFRTLDNHIIQKNEIGPLFYTTHESNSKCIKVLNIRLETINPSEEDLGRKLVNNSLRNKFLGTTPKTQKQKQTDQFTSQVKSKDSSTLQKGTLKQQTNELRGQHVPSCTRGSDFP